MSVFLNPKVNQVLNTLDSSSSMASVVLRDGVDNLGRITQAYARDSHDGRERLIEENLTTLIWGFGIKWIKDKVYDPLVKRFTALKYPAFDISLLQAGPQQLTKDVVLKYAQQDAHLLKLVTEPLLQQKYRLSSVMKFLLATGIPVLTIAFGIPTLNQWLTRRKSAAAAQAAQPARAPQTSLKAGNAFATFLTKPAQSGPAVRFGQGTSFQVGAYARSSGHPDLSAGQSAMPVPAVSGPRFAGVADTLATGVSNLLLNERANTLLVDGTISGGRAWKARNQYERLEVLFQEAGIIFFLYYAQGLIQSRLQRLMDRLFATHTVLGFGELKWLREMVPDAAKLQDAARPIRSLLEEKARLGIQGQSEVFEKKLVESIQNYVADQKNGHLLFDLARHSGAIPTVTDTAGRVLPDLTAKIQTGRITALAEQLQKLTLKLPEAPVPLGRWLEKSIVAKAGAFIASAAVCSLFLGYVIPRAKQAMTYYLTGSRGFPGTMAIGAGKGSAGL